MFNTVKQYLASVGAMNDKIALGTVLSAIADRFSSQATSTAGLLISATTTTAKIGAVDFAGVANGIPVKIAASTDMPALVATQTITAGSFNVVCYFIDQFSTVTAVLGVEATTLANVRFPQFPVGKALVGYLVINASATFTGGTTALSATTSTAYVSPVGAFDPSIVLG